MTHFFMLSPGTRSTTLVPDTPSRVRGRSHVLNAASPSSALNRERTRFHWSSTRAVRFSCRVAINSSSRLSHAAPYESNSLLLF